MAKTTVEATTLLPVLNFYELPKGVGNFSGVALGIAYDSFPPKTNTMPIITTWKEVYQPFTATFRLIDPEGRIASLHDERIEPISDWGYCWHFNMFENSTIIPGLYSLELWANQKLQLKRPMIFNVKEYGDSVDVIHNPDLVVFLPAMIISNLSRTSEVDVKHILGSQGFERGGTLSALTGWVNCTESFKVQYEFLDPKLKSIIQTQLTTNKPSVTNRLPETFQLSRFQLTSIPPVIKPGVYWLRVSYLGKSKRIPILLK